MDQKYDGVFIGREADNINKVYWSHPGVDFEQ